MDNNNTLISTKDINNPNLTPKYYSKDTSGKILLLRHGETFFNIDPDKTGRKTNYKYIDCKLTPKGIEQSKSLKDKINKFSIEVIYISPMYRAFQTVFYALENHPNASNIKIIVHPFVNEVTSCVQDYLLDIKKTKNEFNINSKLKFDWSIFDEYVKNIEYDENFYYFDFFDCLEKNKKNQTYKKLKKLYDMKDFANLEKALGELAIFRYQQKKRLESLKHLQFRFNKFLKFIKQKHRNTLDDNKNKILVVTHTSFIKCATDRTVYDNEDIQNFHPNAYSTKNCEIISIKL